jgi:hypothetical protein
MDTLKDVLKNWYQDVSVRQKAHYLSADHFERKSYWLGIPVIILTTIVGTSVFATLQKQPEPWLQISVGLASVLAAVLASLQTFLGYSNRAEKHRVAEAKYGALKRELEVLLAATKVESSDKVIVELRTHIDDCALESPNNPLRIYKRAGAKSEEAPISMSAPIFQHLCGIALLKRYEYAHMSLTQREWYFLKDSGFIQPRPPHNPSELEFNEQRDGENFAEIAEPTEIGWSTIKLHKEDIPSELLRDRENLKIDPATL